MMPCPPAPGWRRTLLAACLLAALAVGLASVFQILVTPGHADEDDEAESTVHAPSRVTIKNGVVTLTLNKATQENGGIETATPEQSPAQRAIRGYGTIIDAAKITALDNHYRDANARLQKAQAELSVARDAYKRAQTLYRDHQNISAARLQSAKGTFEVDRAALAAARSRLATAAASARQSWGPVLGKALIEGAPLINDLIERRIYLAKVTLPPGIEATKPPPTATGTIGLETRIPLTFISLATSTDPAIQGISYFYKTPAMDGVLPGLNLFVSLPVATGPKGVVVPQSAVVWLEGKAWVYLRTGPDTFIRREIAPGAPGPHGGYIVAALPARDPIVVVGAQMLLSEEFRAQTKASGDEDD